MIADRTEEDRSKLSETALFIQLVGTRKEALRDCARPQSQGGNGPPGTRVSWQSSSFSRTWGFITPLSASCRSPVSCLLPGLARTSIPLRAVVELGSFTAISHWFPGILFYTAFFGILKNRALVFCFLFLWEKLKEFDLCYSAVQTNVLEI